MSLTNVAVDGGVGNPAAATVKWRWTLRLAIAMAPGLSKVIVYEAPNTSPWPDILNRMANDNSADKSVVRGRYIARFAGPDFRTKFSNKCKRKGNRFSTRLAIRTHSLLEFPFHPKARTITQVGARR